MHVPNLIRAWEMERFGFFHQHCSPKKVSSPESHSSNLA